MYLTKTEDEKIFKLDAKLIHGRLDKWDDIIKYLSNLSEQGQSVVVLSRAELLSMKEYLSEGLKELYSVH